jgi:hypothetical protein
MRPFVTHANITDIATYLRMFAGELGDRILHCYPALQKPDDPLSPRLTTLLRKPFPAQAVAAMGIAKKLETDRSAAVIAECGTGKTLISLAALHVHSDGRPFTGIVMAPGHITLKWCKEAFETITRLRVFLIDGLRDRVRDGAPSGVNEVRLRRGQIVREGLHTSLTDLRLRRNHKSARARWQQEICSGDLQRTSAIRSRAGQRKAFAFLAARLPGGSLRTFPGKRGQPRHRRAGGSS